MSNEGIYNVGKDVVKQNTIACLLPSAEDRSNIILGVSRSNNKERGRFKDNVIKKKKN